MAKKKRLPKWLVTVTPLSRAVALLLFIVMPIIGFYLGMRIGMSIVTDRIMYVPTYLERPCKNAPVTPVPMNRPR